MIGESTVTDGGNREVRSRLTILKVVGENYFSMLLLVLQTAKIYNHHCFGDLLISMRDILATY